MNEGQKVEIGPEQVVKAANAGLTLLNTPGAIKVDGPMSISGDLQLLNAVLTAIAQGQVVLGNASPEVSVERTPEEGANDKAAGAGQVVAET